MTTRLPRLLVVTAGAPHAHEEAFTQAEVTAMMEAGHDVVVVPFRRRLRQPNEDAVASGLAVVTVARAMLGPTVIASALVEMARRPAAVGRICSHLVRQSKGRRNLAVNLLAVPKALWLARLGRRLNVTHFHAYWLSHTTTAAMIASELTGIPYSATGYRWDIAEDNLLAQKFTTAKFLRCADEVGQHELRSHVGSRADSVVLIRTGVTLVPWAPIAERSVDTRSWCCPGAFVPKKAHMVLLDAVAIAANTVGTTTIDLFGEGPLDAAIRARVEELGLADIVRFRGYVPLAELQRHFRETRPVCVLPSIRTESGEMEGIPVSLIEAMANGAPVVSTPTGSIADLVVDGTGLLVAPGDPAALAAVLVRLIREQGLAEELAGAARARVESEFDVRESSERVWALCFALADADAL